MDEYQFQYPFYISIHALLAESDIPSVLVNGSVEDFNPRSPCGERLLS